MQYKDRGVTLDRLELLWSGREYPDKYGISLKSKLYEEYAEPNTLVVLRDTGNILFPEAKSRRSSYVPCKVGEEFGDSWHTHWFYVEFQLKDDWIKAGKEVHFLWDSSSEAMIYDLEGKPLQGLTGGEGHERRNFYVVYRKGHREDVDKSGKVAFYVEMACCGLFGNFINGNMLAGLDMEKKFELVQCALGVFDREVWDLMFDFKVLMDCAKYLDTQQQSRADEALHIANEIVNRCKPGDRSTYPVCRELAKKFLSVANASSQHKVYAVGHCHIDMAWLWPFSETRRKGGRSWSSQTELFKQYEPFSFCASSASLYEWVSKDYPLLFKEMQKYAKEGRFLPVGGSWLEFDGYVPSGESMARQMLYGQRFFKQNFGSYCDVFFLPDTFGYSAQLPQLIRLAGMRYFLTQKLSWNRYNKFPHSSFNWKGIDGTTVLTHFPPADTYGGSGDVEEVLKSQTNFKDKGRSNCSLYLFGIGDGGGGPMPSMVDKLQRMKDVSGLPKVVLGSTVGKFYQELESASHDLMTWDGELYLELHNGSYTTMAHNKKYNRMCEFLMRDAEMFATLRSILVDKDSSHYDKPLYDEIWKNMMLFQFHDVLPGTCIRLVYEVTDKEYPVMIDKLRKNIEDSLRALSSAFLQSELVKTGDSNTVVLYNTLNFDRTEVLEWTKNGDAHHSRVTVKGMGCAAYPVSVLEKLEVKPSDCTVLRTDVINISTPLLEVVLNTEGKLLSVKDKQTLEYGDPKTMRELISKDDKFAGGNTLLMHDDVPLYWDAWDLWLYYQETRRELKAQSCEVKQEANYTEVRYKYKISEKSSMEQTVKVYNDTKRIDFVTTVDWHEEHKILRTYFPLAVRTDFVTCDIQCGNLKRPTVANTSWDVAKYEVCSHKFVDMSEAKYGAALLNNCKYGYSARGNLLGMSLLKSSKAPNELADMGRHEFTYSLYPHHGAFVDSDVAEESLKLNVGLYKLWTATSLKEKKELQYAKFDKPSVIVDAFKLDEVERKSLVVRMHENIGSECRNKVEFCFDVKNPATVNLLEEPTDEWEVVDKEGEQPKSIFKSDARQVFHRLKPFQILTMKMDPAYK